MMSFLRASRPSRVWISLLAMGCRRGASRGGWPRVISRRSVMGFMRRGSGRVLTLMLVAFLALLAQLGGSEG